MGLIPAAILAFSLIAVLFAVAAFVEARVERQAIRRNRQLAYILALGVYCSSWTFYGAVGSAASAGWNYLPIYLGPVILLVFARSFLARLGQAVADEQATSISDYIASRFGHDIAVGRLVAVICLLGTVPYIALQLRSIGNALSFVSGRDIAATGMVCATLALAGFAVLFGIRRFEIAGRSEGLVFAIGLESLIKVGALGAVALLAMTVLVEAPAEQARLAAATLAARFDPGLISLDTAVICALSLFAIVALPRQFYMGLVEAGAPGDLARGAPGLALYIAAMALMAPAIALGGFASLAPGTEPDLFVLALPLEARSPLIAGLALIGGISAAAAMAIVDSTALATMVSNDLFLATLLRSQGIPEGGALGRRVLAIRRAAVAAVMAASLAWALLVGERETLASIGLIAFAAMAQFTPHLVLATYVPQRDPLPARASMSIGLALWLYTLALPPILPAAWLDWLAATPLDPLRLFQIGNAGPLVHGVFWSLGLNLLAFALLSARRIPRPALPKLLRVDRHVRDQQGLINLVGGFIGAERAQAEFAGFDPRAPVDRRSAKFAQDLLARVIGAAPARALVASALAGGTMSIAQVTRLLDEGGQSLRFSRQLLASTFENIAAGISVVDADMNLVAWNSRYLDLFDYPAGLVHVGAPVADLIRYNAARGDFGPGGGEEHVAKRLAFMRAGTTHAFERERADGRVIKTVGGPMPGGGYVMSFTDITDEARMQQALSRTLDELETRVEERTAELSAANARLAGSDMEKTRFLAAASHDLLQPLHVARLFTAALSRRVEGEPAALAARIDEAIVSAETMLRALLDISRIDAGGVVPHLVAVPLGPFLDEVCGGLKPLADAKGLRLRWVASERQVTSDPALLRSIAQNLVSNAIRYTERGGIVVGIRAGGGHTRIVVADSGVGVAPHLQEEVFGEFVRIGEVEAEGVGLGLALSRRLATLLGGTITLSSQPGRGSCFTLDLPAAAQRRPAAAAGMAAPPAPRAPARALRVLVLDDEAEVVAATSAWLANLGHAVQGATTLAQALGERGAGGYDCAIVDYRLGRELTGIDAIRALREAQPGLPALIVTATDPGEIVAAAEALQVELIAKPGDPARIERFLARVSRADVDPE